MSDARTAADTTVISLLRRDRTVLTAGAFALAATAFTVLAPPPWLGRVPQAVSDIASGTRQQVEQEITVVRGQYEQANAELAKTTEAAAQKDQTIAALRSEAGAARAEGEQAAAARIAEAENARAASERQAAAQAEGLVQANRDLAAGATRLTTLEAERDRLQGRLDTLETRLASATGSLATAERALATRTEALAARDATIDEQRRLLSTMTADLQTQETTLARLNADLERARTAAQRDATTRLLESEQAVAALEDTVAEQTQTLGRLRQQLEQGVARVRALEGERAQQAETLAGLTAARDGLDQKVAAYEADLAKLRTAQQALTGERDQLAARVGAGETAVTQLTAQLATAEQSLVVRNDALAQRQAEVERLTGDLRAAGESAQAETTRLTAALTAAQADVAKAQTELASETARREQVAQDLVARQSELKEANDRGARLAQQSQALGGEVLRIGAVLHAAEQALGRQVELGSQQRAELEAALAGTAGQLAKYRSEFFTRLGAVVGGRDDVQVVGDRFVMQAEILFDSGSAELGEQGKSELAKVAGTILQVAPMIPDGVPWVLRIDGHTDNVPIHTAAFASNWDLSTARAISVVEFLTSQGVPPEHLAATGFGEFQPIASGEDPEMRRRNRRIELKLTDR